MSSPINTENSSATENISSGRWTKQEHQRFIEAMNLYGKNWKKVQDHVGTRTGAQIRSHAQKFFTRLEREINKENIPDEIPKAMRKKSSEKGDTNSSVAKKKKLDGPFNIVSLEGIKEGSAKSLNDEQKVLCEKSLQGNEANLLTKFDNPILVLKTLFGTVAESVMNFCEESNSCQDPLSRKNSFFSNNLSNFMERNREGEIPRLSDLVEMPKQERRSFDVQPHEPVEKAIRRGSFQIYRESEFSAKNINLQRKLSLYCEDTTAHSKKVKLGEI